MQGLEHHCALDCNSSRPNPPSATLCTTRSIFACFGVGSTIQKSTRGCSRQTVVAVCLYGGICHRFTPTNSISDHAYTPFACKTGVAGLATPHSKGDDMCICIAQCTSSPPRLPVCVSRNLTPQSPSTMSINGAIALRVRLSHSTER